MTELDKRVAGNWFEIKEAAQEFIPLKDHFRIPEGELRQHLSKLKLAVEKGIVEYKIGTLNPLFRILEGTKYQSISIPEIELQQSYIRTLLYITLIQRQFTEGILKIFRDKTAEERIRPDDLDLKAILKDVDSRIKEDPTFSARPSVKNILVQAMMYRKERETMQKLLPTIKQEKRSAFTGNFKKTFADIFESIKHNYLDILKEENPPSEENRNILERIPLRELMPGLTGQCQCISRILSTLQFVKEEKYKTREILIRLGEEKDRITSLFDNEMATYDRLAAGAQKQTRGTVEQLSSGRREGARSISRQMALEILHFLKRDLPVLPSA